MPEAQNPNLLSNGLRALAEAKVLERPPVTVTPTTPEESNRLFHELRVHQIELEMQNEELRRGRLELDAARARYFAIYDLAPIGYLTLDPAGVIRETNLTASTMLGVSRFTLNNHPLTNYILPADQDTYYHFRRQLARHGDETQTCELRLQRANGAAIWVSLQISAVQPGEYGVALSDISARKQAQETLAASERFLKNILASVGEELVVLDREYRILAANRAFCEQHGQALEDMVGRHCYEVSHQATRPCQGSEHLCPVAQTWATGNAAAAVHQHRSADGVEHHMEIKSYPMQNDGGEIDAVIEVMHDVSEKLEMTEKLRHSQKMEVIGTLAGGIAHDFNNILTAILGYAEIVRDGLPADSPLRESQNYVIQGGMRAAELVKQILTFSRKSGRKAEPLLVQFVIKEALKLIRASLPTTIAISEDIDVTCGQVLADPTQIHQLLMNLCTNAKQAIGDNSGVLSVSLKAVSLNEEAAQALGNLPVGPYVALEVGDTGCGISQEIQTRIFEPYFTTKEVGQGSGLGLAVVHGIATVMGGAVDVESEPSHGATFRVYLPMIASVSGAEQLLEPEVLRGGSESLLLVDDEEEIVDLLGLILGKLGYRVTKFTDSTMALAAFQAAPESFDLLVTDMTMPNLTGLALAHEVLRLQPKLPIILCTGFSETMNEAKAKASGIKAFLMKPLGKGPLAQVVRRALDGAK